MSTLEVPLARLRTDRAVRGAHLSLLAQVTGAMLTYLLQIVLARALGRSGLGVVTWVTAWSGPLGMVAALGLPSAVLRLLPAYRAQGDAERLQGLLRAGERIVLAASVGVAALATAVALVLSEHPAALVVGMWTLPLTVQLRYQSELARAAGRYGVAFALPLVQPFFMLAAAVAGWIALGRLTPTLALVLPALGAVTVLPWQRACARRTLTRGGDAVYDTRDWLRVGLGLLAVDAFGIAIAQADSLLLGAMRGPGDLALFGAAAGTAAFATFPMVAVGAVVVPMFAAEWARGRPDRLERIACSAVRWAFWPQAAIAALLATASGVLLQTFGAEFADGRPALILLLAGQLANTATGFVGSVMNMTGHHHVVRRSIVVAAGANVVLVALGIHVAGVTGAAAGTALSTLAWNLRLYALARRHVGIRPSILDATVRRSAAA